MTTTDYALRWLLSQPDFLLTQNRLVVAGIPYSNAAQAGETAEDLVNMAYEKLVAEPARLEMRRGEE